MSRWAWLGEQENNLTTYSMLCHGILLIYSFSMWILLSDVAKYSFTSHGIFCHVKSMVCSKMNNGLFTLNMGLAKKAVKNIMWVFENIFVNWRMHFIIPRATNVPNVQCFWTMIIIFSKNLKWVGIAYFINIWWKLTSQSILNIWQTCVEMAKVLYINMHHFTMMENLQSGGKNEWAKLNI